ncbi:MAG: hypothetical protein H0T76_00405 [Nannocystis sp.]|nr:hypothetical protein [Nannocystis sp.]
MKSTGSVILALSDLQWLQRFAAMLARDADDADDLVQETLVAVWANPPRDAERPARPWLATVLRNLFRMQRRAGARRERREQHGSSISETRAEPERELARREVGSARRPRSPSSTNRSRPSCSVNPRATSRSSASSRPSSAPTSSRFAGARRGGSPTCRR